MKFDTLKINPLIQKGIVESGYSEMTDIQETLIPALLENRDAIGQAPTGTGKTCAFALPTLEKLDTRSHDIQTLVLAPTRELAMQIIEEYRRLGQFIPNFKALAIYGGQDIKKQLRFLTTYYPQVIVATPGRMLDHLKRKSINLSKVKQIVLDEADEMLNMGFLRDIDRIFQYTNKEHQTILLSATMPKEIVEISRKYQTNPLSFKATLAEKDIPAIAQHYIHVNDHDKVEVIIKLINDKKFFLVLIFTNTKHKAKWLVKQLRSNKFNADAIHGDLKQNARDRVMRMFREGKLQILIATDIAARGIDVKGVDAVINYDVPKNMDYYIHRIGRTARAQMTGSAYTLISSDIHGNIRDIERVTKDKLSEHKVEGYVKSDVKPDYQDRPRYEHRDRKDFSRGRDNKRFDRGERKFNRNDNGAPRPVHNKTPGTTRMFITVGTMDNVDNHSLKDFLVKDVGISASDITDVYTKDRFSFVEVKNEITEKILNVKSVNGRNVHVSIAKERGSDGGNRGNDRGRRPQGNFRRGGGNFRGERKPFRGGGERKSFHRDNEHKTFHGFGQSNDRPSRDGQHRDFKSRKFIK